MLFSITSLATRFSCSRTIKVKNIPKKISSFGCFQRFYSENGVDSDKIVEELSKGDEEMEKKVRILMLEVDVMRQDGRLAPETLKLSHWQYLVNLPTRSQRFKYLTFLWKLEKTKLNQKEKKAEKKRLFEETGHIVEKEFPDDIEYGLSNRSMFMRIRDKSIDKFFNKRVIQAMLHSQSVVIDCSYETNMMWRETINAARQMTFVFGSNRIHKEPFNMHLCNVDVNGLFMKQLKKNIPSISEPWFPLNVHEKSYLDIFPKKDLVYLTPHCRDELTTYDHDAVYIVGCMVDKANNEPLSLAKAKKEGIKMAKLPLDRYLEWGTGSKKTLNINHMLDILLDLRSSGDWDHALRHVPRRKLLQTQIQAFTNSNSIKAQNIMKYNIGNKIRNKYVYDFKKKHSLYDDENKY